MGDNGPAFLAEISHAHFYKGDMPIKKLTFLKISTYTFHIQNTSCL